MVNDSMMSSHNILGWLNLYSNIGDLKRQILPPRLRTLRADRRGDQDRRRSHELGGRE